MIWVSLHIDQIMHTVLQYYQNSTQTVVHGDPAVLSQQYYHTSECDFAETSMSLLASSAVHWQWTGNIYTTKSAH